ncbi:uncharacterized protein METZ01_LOCUS121653 [marine metagenome]|uniref:Uncharacterized protein n=1 Tax=marine metagenome TaxID=408172 RepID=A0A381XVJ4_9ZZZZ
MTISAKQKKIDNAKKGAPKVPGDTCPSINYVQDIIEQISDRTDDDWAAKQVGVINGVLEYIRESNEELRNSSYYWYKKYKGAA